MKENIMNWKFTIGMNDKDLHKQILTRSQFDDIIISVVGDCTFQSAKGVYKGEIENTLIVSVYGKFDLAGARMAARELCHRLNQETIIISPIVEECEFIAF